MPTLRGNRRFAAHSAFCSRSFKNTQQGGRRLVAARSRQPFADVQDVKTRAALDEKDMNALAQADAFRFLAGHRREALWKTLGTEVQAPLLKNVARVEQQASLLPPTKGQDVLADYQRVGLTLRSHPLKLLRPKLRQMRLKSSDEIREARAQVNSFAPRALRLTGSGLIPIAG